MRELKLKLAALHGALCGADMALYEAAPHLPAHARQVAQLIQQCLDRASEALQAVHPTYWAPAPAPASLRAACDRILPALMDAWHTSHDASKAHASLCDITARLAEAVSLTTTINSMIAPYTGPWHRTGKTSEPGWP